jgi:hypothetical protein
MPANVYGYGDNRLNLLWSKVSFHVVPAINSLFKLVNSIPPNLYRNTMGLTNSIADKMQNIGDVYTTGVSDKKSLDIVPIATIHFQYLEDLRKKNKPKYFELLQILKMWKQLGIQGKTDLANKLLVLYFSNRIKFS